MRTFKWEWNTLELSDKFIILVIGIISVWRKYFSRNVGIGSNSQDVLGDDKISLTTSVSEAGLNTVRVVYNWKLNFTTRSRTRERSINLGDLILEMFGKRIAEWISWIMRGQRNRSFSIESPIYTVPELTRIVRVVSDHVPIKINLFKLKFRPLAGIEPAALGTKCQVLNR